MGRKDKITLSLFLHRSTDKAMLFSEDGDEGEAVWLPKSQIEYDHSAATGDRTDVLVPEWLAEEKGFMA